MNRIDFLMQGMELNEVQASLVSELISDIPNSQLKNFLIFRMNYIEPYKSKELITKTALFDYRRIQAEQKLWAGEKIFQSADEVRNFIETYYKGRDIGFGLNRYFDYVVIHLDLNCNMINKYGIDEYGNNFVLNSSEKAEVYNYLFENQHKIGYVKYISKDEVEQNLQLEHIKQEAPKEIEQDIRADILENIQKIYKTV